MKMKLNAVFCIIQCLLLLAVVGTLYPESAHAQGNGNYRSGLSTLQDAAIDATGDQRTNPLMADTDPQVNPNGTQNNEAGPESGTYADLGFGNCCGAAATPPQSSPQTQYRNIPKGAADAAKLAAQRTQVGMAGLNTAATNAVSLADSVAQMGAMASRPLQQAQAGKAGAAGAATEAADVAGEIGHEMAETAISYTSSYLHNFTVEGGNRWNQIRDNIFVPMGVLLLLPGAVLSQVRAIMAAGNPVLGQVNPFDGILRSIVAVFMIPGTYLVVNYGIDLSNSITHTIADEYTRLFGSDMYRDAICHEIKAMPWRLPEENRNTIDIPVSSMGIIMLGNYTPFAQLEADLIAVKIFDPCAGIYIVPPDRANEAVPAAVMAARLMANSSNCSLVTSWAILCAFQLAYLYYLWCVGPVVAGLWVWPMKHLRDALPNWVEGVVTLCFWALFWNTIVLLIACFRGVDETGTIIMLALNTLANLTVKFAFDFAGLVRAAGGEAMKLGEKMAAAIEKAGKGGGGGGGGGGNQQGGDQNNQGPGNQPNGPSQQPGTGPQPPAPAPINTDAAPAKVDSAAHTPAPPTTLAATGPEGGNRPGTGFTDPDTRKPDTADMPTTLASASMTSPTVKTTLPPSAGDAPADVGAGGTPVTATAAATPVSTPETTARSVADIATAAGMGVTMISAAKTDSGAGPEATEAAKEDAARKIETAIATGRGLKTGKQLGEFSDGPPLESASATSTDATVASPGGTIGGGTPTLVVTSGSGSTPDSTPGTPATPVTGGTISLARDAAGAEPMMIAAATGTPETPTVGALPVTPTTTNPTLARGGATDDTVVTSLSATPPTTATGTPPEVPVSTTGGATTTPPVRPRDTVAPTEVSALPTAETPVTSTSTPVAGATAPTVAGAPITGTPDPGMRRDTATGEVGAIPHPNAAAPEASPAPAAPAQPNQIHPRAAAPEGTVTSIDPATGATAPPADPIIGSGSAPVAGPGRTLGAPGAPAAPTHQRTTGGAASSLPRPQATSPAEPGHLPAGSTDHTSAGSENLPRPATEGPVVTPGHAPGSGSYTNSGYTAPIPATGPSSSAPVVPRDSAGSRPAVSTGGIAPGASTGGAPEVRPSGAHAPQTRDRGAAPAEVTPGPQATSHADPNYQPASDSTVAPGGESDSSVHSRASIDGPTVAYGHAPGSGSYTSGGFRSPAPTSGPSSSGSVVPRDSAGSQPVAQSGAHSTGTGGTGHPGAAQPTSYISGQSDVTPAPQATPQSDPNYNPVAPRDTAAGHEVAGSTMPGSAPAPGGSAPASAGYAPGGSAPGHSASGGTISGSATSTGGFTAPAPQAGPTGGGQAIGGSEGLQRTALSGETVGSAPSGSAPDPYGASSTGGSGYSSAPGGSAPGSTSHVGSSPMNTAPISSGPDAMPNSGGSVARDRAGEVVAGQPYSEPAAPQSVAPGSIAPASVAPDSVTPSSPMGGSTGGYTAQAPHYGNTVDSGNPSSSSSLPARPTSENLMQAQAGGEVRSMNSSTGTGSPASGHPGAPAGHVTHHTGGETIASAPSSSISPTPQSASAPQGGDIHYDSRTTQEYIQSQQTSYDSSTGTERPLGSEPSQRFDRGAVESSGSVQPNYTSAGGQQTFEGHSQVTPQPSSLPQNVDPGSGGMSQHTQQAVPPDHSGGQGSPSDTMDRGTQAAESVAYMQDRDREQHARDVLDSQPRTPGAQPGFVPVSTPSPVVQRPAAPSQPPQTHEKIVEKNVLKPQGMTDKNQQQKGAKPPDKGPARKNSDDLQPQKGGIDRGKNPKKGKPNLLNSALGRANSPHLEDENEEDEDEKNKEE